jgi:hypothetical protein
MKIRIRQVYYDWFQQGSLLKGSEPYYYPLADPFLENRVLRDCVRCGDHLGSDYYGVLSWRFSQKTGKKGVDVQSAIERDADRPDVYSFFGNAPDANVWLRAVLVCHPLRLAEIAQKIFNRLGRTEDIFELKTPVIYSNYWIARPFVLERYVSEMLVPAMSLMEEDDEIRTLCFEDARYRPVHHRALSPRKCKKIFGRPYYTYHPFICERLFPSWLALHPEVRFKNFS